MIGTAATRKDEILKSAAVLFREKGYAATSMRDLAGAVGMEAASLYNHISNKEEILEVICTTVANLHAENLSTVDRLSVNALEKLRALVRAQIGLYMAHPELSAVAEDEWKHLNEPFRTEFLLKRREYEGALRNLITLSQNEGQLKRVDTRLALYTMLSALQWLHHWYRRERPLSADKIEEELMEMIFSGLMN